MLVAQNSLGPVCPVPLTVRGNWLYLKRHYERVAEQRPRARATVARVAQKLDEVPTEMRHSIAKSECSICLSRRAEFGAAAAARPVVVLPCKHAFHAKCLENWFAMSLTRLSADDLTCPLCRQAVPAAPRRRRDGEDATGEVELRDV